MTALTKLQILIDCQTYQWQYKLDKANIQINTFQRFQKRIKRAMIYALVEINHLISFKTSLLTNELPESLQYYLDVFSDSNIKKLTPHRDIDLAIELQPGKEPLYKPIYLLLQTELVAL